MPLITLISASDEQQTYLRVARVVLAKPSLTKIDLYTLQFALRQPIQSDIFLQICDVVLARQQ
jgi:hypothetical protein